MSNSAHALISIRRSFIASSLLLLAVGVSAQTAPQLLPYTTKLIAGGGATATFTVGQICPVASAPYTAQDKYGDGCLATEVQLASTDSGPRHAAVDVYGNVFLGDYSAGLVRRVDAVTGIITAVGGNALLTASPASGTACGTGSTTTSTDILGDGCQSSQVHLGRPSGIAFDSAGNLYFSDPYAYNVRKIAAISGFVGYTTVNNSGSGYTAAPTVTFSPAPTGGTTATGTATISSTGVVLGILITNPGSGYTAAPTITFSASPAGTTATATATVYTVGIPPAGGTISLIDGDDGGTKSSYGYESNNGSLTSCAETGAVCINAATQGYLDGPEGIAFDPNGNLYIADYYETTILAVNTTASENTVTGVGIPGGTISKILGAPASANTLAPGGVSGTTVCINGTGCSYSQVFLTGTANATLTDYPFGVTYDTSGNVYFASEYYDNIAIISASGALSNFAGTPGTRGTNTATTPLAVTRGPAGTFPIGSSYDVTADNYPSANVYFPDSTNGFIWRVDGSGKNMYLLAGGGPGTCPTATDAFGDGCTGLQANFSASGGNGTSSATASSGVYGAYVDTYADLFIADQKNNLVRELASGTQFGVVGANQPVQTIEIHFAAGDVPSTAVYTLTTNPTNFSLGKLTCNGISSIDKTTDCTLPITATPTTYGYFSSNLQIISSDGTNNFLLTGIFEPSPKTRTSLIAGSSACSGTTTYSSTLPTTMTATLTYNGPTVPNGVFNFYVNGSTTPLNPKPIAVSNLSSSGAPVYGATYAYTFSTPGIYAIDAVYTGDTYYLQSTSSSITIVSSSPTYTLVPVSNQENTVVPGQTALYSFTVPSVYVGTVSFAVTGLPPNSSYSLTPNGALTLSGCSTSSTFALSILTQAQTVVQPASIGSGRGPWQILSLCAGFGLALFIGLRRRRLPVLYGRLGMMLALLLTMSAATGCGKAVGTVIQPGTPASPANQPYQIVVTPTGTAGTAPAPITFSLTVL